MAAIALLTCRDPRRLLEHAASAFLEAPGESAAFPSPSSWLILRQGGIRDDLLALAAERGVPGWFDPPLALLAELPALLADLPLQPVGDFERLVLVNRALRESAGPAFGRIRDLDAYADPVDRWIGELIAEGIDPGVVQALRRRGGDAFERARDAELLATYARYLQLLEQAERRDPRARLVDCARAIEAGVADGARLGGRREIRLFGLSDPRGGWLKLLHALRAWRALDRVIIYAAEPLGFVTGLADSVESLDATPHFADTVFGDVAPTATRADQVPAPPRVVLVSAPDLPREVEEVCARVRALLETGVAPHRVAVVSRSARPYVDRVIRTLARLDVPASARIRHALPEVPAVRALLTLFHVAAGGWERAGLVELAETPYFRSQLDAGVLNHIGFQRRVGGLAAWRAALERLHGTARRLEQDRLSNPDDEDLMRVTLPAAERVAQALRGFDEFTAQAAALDEPRPLPAWLDWLDTFLDDDPWRLERALFRAPGSRLAPVRVDLAAWRGMREIVAEWRAAESTWGGGEPIGVAAFDARLRSMLDGDAALFTPVRRGVQVLEGLAASFRSFDHVFIVGLDSARMPLRPASSPLLDEHTRRELREAGLAIDTPQQWEERERALFLNMLATARSSITLSFARYDDAGAEQLASSFFEETQHGLGLAVEAMPGSRAFTPGLPLVPDHAALEHARSAARAELERAEGAVSPWNGRIEDESMRTWLAAELGEARIWSPTQLEYYAKCPWAYFSSRLLRLEKLEDPDLDMDPRTRGSILHDALRRFFAAASERSGGEPVFLLAPDLEWARQEAGRATESAIADAGDHVRLGHHGLERQKLAELRRQLISYIEWEIEENEKSLHSTRSNAYRWVRTGVVDHEVAFDDIAFEVDGVSIRFRGFIDRVETGVDERGGTQDLVAAVDYKSTVYSTPAGGKPKGWEDGVVLQVPLYAYALTKLRPGARTARVEYRAIRSPARAHTLPLYQYDRHGLLFEDAQKREQYETALRDVARHVAAARAGAFPPDPPQSCNCPPFCHARDICRVAGGPRA